MVGGTELLKGGKLYNNEQGQKANKKINNNTKLEKHLIKDYA